eukprot:s215_g25.t3
MTSIPTGTAQDWFTYVDFTTRSRTLFMWLASGAPRLTQQKPSTAPAPANLHTVPAMSFRNASELVHSSSALSGVRSEPDIRARTDAWKRCTASLVMVDLGMSSAATVGAQATVGRRQQGGWFQLATCKDDAQSPDPGSLWQRHCMLHRKPRRTGLKKLLASGNAAAELSPGLDPLSRTNLQRCAKGDSAVWSFHGECLALLKCSSILHRFTSACHAPFPENMTGWRLPPTFPAHLPIKEPSKISMHCIRLSITTFHVHPVSFMKIMKSFWLTTPSLSLSARSSMSCSSSSLRSSPKFLATRFSFCKVMKPKPSGSNCSKAFSTRGFLSVIFLTTMQRNCSKSMVPLPLSSASCAIMRSTSSLECLKPRFLITIRNSLAWISPEASESQRSKVALISSKSCALSSPSALDAPSWQLSSFPSASTEASATTSTCPRSRRPERT